MKNKFFLIVLFVLANFPINAKEKMESSESDAIGKFISWIKNFDKLILSINDRENLLQLHALLGNVSIDISKLTTKKSDLALHIYAANLNDSTTKKRLSSEASDVQSAISVLINDIDRLQYLLPDSTTFNMVTNVQQALNYRKEALIASIAYKLQNGEKIEKNQVTKDAEQAILIAKNALAEVLSARDKIKKKMQE